MQFRRCSDTACRRPYQIERQRQDNRHPKLFKLHCPHCSRAQALCEEDVFQLLPLTGDQEAVYDLYFPVQEAGLRQRLKKLLKGVARKLKPTNHHRSFNRAGHTGHFEDLV